LLTNIYRTDHIPEIDYAYHSLLEAPSDLEAPGLSLHSLLVNPALSDLHRFGCVDLHRMWRGVVTARGIVGWESVGSAFLNFFSCGNAFQHLFAPG